MALSGKASRQAAQESREKLKLGNLELKNEAATLKVKEQELKVDRQSFLLEKQKANIFLLHAQHRHFLRHLALRVQRDI